MRLQGKVDALPMSEPTQRVMEELALYKGHRYASVVLDCARQLLLVLPRNVVLPV